MTDATATAPTAPRTRAERDALTRKRYAAERRFRLYGMVAIGIAITALVVLLASVLGRGLPAFTQTVIRAEIFLDPEPSTVTVVAPPTTPIAVASTRRGAQQSSRRHR